MAKGARKRAARYSELSKEGKKRQREKSAPKQRHVSVPASSASRPQPTATKAPRAQEPTTKPQSVHSSVALDFSHVRGDLKRIGILAGAFVVLLIILALTLG